MDAAAVKYLVVHCSATPPSADIGATEIDRWHREKGWRCIGYHYVIRRDGALELGRPLHMAGAHVEGYNDQSIGVCLVGGVSRKGAAECNFTDAQFRRLRALLTQVLVPKFPGAVIQGHRDFPKVAKACPSFDVRTWWLDQQQGANACPTTAAKSSATSPT